MKLPCLLQPRILKEVIKALVKGPYTTKFPYKPHIPPESFRGRPEFHQDDCVGCTACVEVCPPGAITFKDEIKNGQAKRIFTIRWDMCIFCGQCQLNCLSEKGIILTQEFDLATTEDRHTLSQTIEKELVLCEGCNEIIAPKDQILWVAKKIGPLAFSNPSLMLFYLKEQSLADVDIQILKEKPTFQRSDRLRILCPKCRRETILKS